MNHRDSVANALAHAMLAGEWDAQPMATRTASAIADHHRRRWIRDLVAIVAHEYPHPPLDRPRELAAFIAACEPFAAHVDRRTRIVRWFTVPTTMAARRWPVPVIDTVADLAGFLGLAIDQLAWFADTRSLERHTTADDERLRHYRYAVIRKANGAPRVVEAPKPRLKALQRTLLQQILDVVPPHEAAHGFRRGHSVITHARHHTDSAVVIRIDLENFFSAVTAGRVFGIWRTMGYAEPVAHALTGLSTNVVPREVWNAVRRPPSDDLVDAYWRHGRQLAAPHLPQGAPTSPGLANLAAYRLDVRLAALAATFGATYTRYADDIVLSGDDELRRRSRTIVDMTTRIARDEGFRVNDAKTRVAPRHQRQRVTGIVVNDTTNVARDDYDRLRATLHNCVHRGAATQNRADVADFRSHLAGRIAWVASLNEARGEKLRRMFDQVVW